MKIRVLIVDDEPLARERIRSLLKNEPDFEVVGESTDGPNAVREIREKCPALVFLDVQMPGMDGFQVLRALASERLPLVVFVTAYDQHALKAFDVHAVDYLLKPFKQSRFRETLEHVRKQLANPAGAPAPEALMELLRHWKAPREPLARIVVKDGDRVLFVRTQDIEYIESAGNYVVVHTGKENHVVRETLSALEEQLDSRKFLRVSRSVLVNLEEVKELQPMFKGEHVVLLRSGKQLPMTRGLREVQEALKFA
jgi:two-component system LytT family response regulator